MTVSLENVRHVHFVGIAGIGMSALARYLLARGYEVSGSDREPGEQGRALAELGARVERGHDASHVDRPDLVVVTSAIAPDNPEFAAARHAGIPVLKRAELLGSIANAGYSVAVAGTHGKTTTSSLIGHMLVEADLDPTILVGGINLATGSNARVGSDLIVVEADEYDASFLQLRPDVAVITSAEPDHLDFYQTPERLRAAYRTFAEGVSSALFACADDPVLPGLVDGVEATVVTYGLDAGEKQAHRIDLRPDGTCFQLDGKAFHTALAGLHNVRNCVAAILVTRELGIGEAVLADALASFPGVARRFEIKGEANGVLIIDDYAHHPTEIRVNLEALRRRFNRPVRLVFQPHTYSRTKAFLADFARSFEDADALYLLDVYAARESDTLGVTGETLAEATAWYHPRVRYSGTLDQSVADVLADVQPGDVVITMGAGDVDTVGPRIMEELRAR